MKRLVALVVVVLFAGLAYAHEGMQHVMGTVVAITENSLTVKATNGTTQMVVLNSQTKYAKGTSVIAQKDVKVGDHVVVHAAKKRDQLIAAEIKLGTAHGMGDMKGMHGDMNGMDMSGAKSK
ncbi:DUF5666 domain-containing protein [Terriglobus albidus]|uniref:DUF5666 domain-containing protein n=1 Tax=Terriglobus albidus TaxID=1592106 RepID=UPI0021E035B5|nr:DUF5666 domain-containing protein [Terriglobus albidus]